MVQERKFNLTINFNTNINFKFKFYKIQKNFVQQCTTVVQYKGLEFCCFYVFHTFLCQLFFFNKSFLLWIFFRSCCRFVFEVRRLAPPSSRSTFSLVYVRHFGLKATNFSVPSLLEKTVPSLLEPREEVVRVIKFTCVCGSYIIVSTNLRVGANALMHVLLFQEITRSFKKTNYLSRALDISGFFSSVARNEWPLTF